MKKKLEIAQRKICYGVCYFIFHVIAVNRLDSGILSIVTFYLTIGLYLVFNVIRPKKHAVFLGFYITTSFASAFACWIGTHTIGVHIH